MARSNILKGILGVDVAITKMERVVGYLARNARYHKGQYITLCNAESAVRAYESDEYRDVLNESFVILPDGQSIPLIHRLRGFHKAEQVQGDMMRKSLWDTTGPVSIRHYIYCADQKIVDRICDEINTNYPQLNIAAVTTGKNVGLMNPRESQDFIQDVNSTGADMLWLIGGDAFMQDVWMHGHARGVEALVVGIGKKHRQSIVGSIKYVYYLIKYLLR